MYRFITEVSTQLNDELHKVAASDQDFELKVNLILQLYSRTVRPNNLLDAKQKQKSPLILNGS